MQSVPIYFIITYAYFTTTSRTDGYGIELYEYSTVSFVHLTIGSLLMVILGRPWFLPPL